MPRAMVPSIVSRGPKCVPMAVRVSPEALAGPATFTPEKPEVGANAASRAGRSPVSHWARRFVIGAHIPCVAMMTRQICNFTLLLRFVRLRGPSLVVQISHVG